MDLKKEVKVDLSEEEWKVFERRFKTLQKLAASANSKLSVRISSDGIKIEWMGRNGKVVMRADIKEYAKKPSRRCNAP